MKLYSIQTGGFYDSKIHGKNIPSDAIEISDQEHQQLLASQSSGKNISMQNGRPTAQDRPPMPLEQRRRQALDGLEKNLHEYIFKAYPQPTQISLQAIYSRPVTPAAVKTDIEAVWTWIASIMAYYYQCKAEIGAMTDADVIEGYQWDFTPFDLTRPAVTLQGIFAAL